jgi:2'-5' RNA ligase
MRLFIAIELPAEIKDKLVGLRQDIAGARWVNPEQLHLTLLFLGEQTEETLDRLVPALSEIRVVPIELEIITTGCFPHPRAARVLWAGFKPQPKMNRLAERVRTAAESCGILLEKRPFSPHITLARLKQSGASDVSRFLDQNIRGRFPLIDIRQFVLFQSCLTQQGAIHKPIRLFPAEEAEL